MHYRSLSLLALSGALVVAACAKDQTDAPLAPTAISRSVARSAAECNFTAMRADARLLFATPGPVLEKVTAMQRAYAAGQKVGATNAGFDVLARVGPALATAGAIIGSPTVGDTFVKDVLGCMAVGALPSGFSVSGSFLPNGLFAVVGGAGDPTGPVTSRALPTYGAEPQAGQSWFGSAGNNRFLLYGYERNFSFTPETPAATTAFELATVPTPLVFSPAIAGGICQTTVTNAQIQHVNIILALRSLSFCSGFASIQPQSRGFFASIGHAAAGWLTPEPLYAFRVGGTGSLLSGLSPGGAVTYLPSTVVLDFVQQPSDASQSTRPQFVPAVAVHAETANGTPINGVLITITRTDALGNIASLPNSSAYTDGSGVALFPNIIVERLGTYTLTASGLVFATATMSTVSQSFTVSAP
ncbi:MAG: carboxypeptidase-like regulatory domain-containing protein [bacterium]